MATLRDCSSYVRYQQARFVTEPLDGITDSHNAEQMDYEWELRMSCIKNLTQFS